MRAYTDSQDLKLIEHIISWWLQPTIFKIIASHRHRKHHFTWPYLTQGMQPTYESWSNTATGMQPQSGRWHAFDISNKLQGGHPNPWQYINWGGGWLSNWNLIHLQAFWSVPWVLKTKCLVHNSTRATILHGHLSHYHVCLQEQEICLSATNRPKTKLQFSPNWHSHYPEEDEKTHLKN